MATNGNETALQPAKESLRLHEPNIPNEMRRAKAILDVIEEMPEYLDFNLASHALTVMESLGYEGPAKPLAQRLAQKYNAGTLPPDVFPLIDKHIFNSPKFWNIINEYATLDTLLKEGRKHLPGPLRNRMLNSRRWAAEKLEQLEGIRKFFPSIILNEDFTRQALFYASQTNYHGAAKKLLQNIAITYAYKGLTGAARQDFEDFYTACRKTHAKVSETLMNHNIEIRPFNGFRNLNKKLQMEAWAVYSALKNWSARSDQTGLIWKAFDVAEKTEHRAAGKWVLETLYSINQMHYDAREYFTEKLAGCSMCRQAVKYLADQAKR